MEALEELKKWVSTLTIAEKRYIKVIGKARAGAKGSQQLALLDWLSQADAGDMPKADAPFLHNLPTNIQRLKELILDCLHMLEKQLNVDAQLRHALEQVALLSERKLYAPALRTLRRAKKTAHEFCRYSVGIYLLEWEQKLVRLYGEADVQSKLESLRTEEAQLMASLGRLQDLRYRTEILQARKIFVPRDSAVLNEVRAFCAPPWIEAAYQSGSFLENALATHILGIRDLFEREPKQAVLRYERLLLAWQAHPDWQRDQAQLLLTICKTYQSACFYAERDWPEVRRHLALIPDFTALAPDTARDFQRLLYHSHYLTALNNGNFTSINALIPEIDRWLRAQGEALTEAQVLPFLNNFAVAEFLQGHYAAANRHVLRILQLPSRKQREDIREFAMVLQALLQYELGDEDLRESLTRAGKRHFSKQGHELAFELAVFRYLELALRMESPAQVAAARHALVAELDQIAEQLPDTVPLLGLMEVRLWATAQAQRQPIQSVFLAAVEANLAALA